MKERRKEITAEVGKENRVNENSGKEHGNGRAEVKYHRSYDSGRRKNHKELLESREESSKTAKDMRMPYRYEESQSVK